MQAQNWYWYFIDIDKMARIGIGILLTKSEWSELVLVFYWCPKVDNAQPCSITTQCLFSITVGSDIIPQLYPEL